MSYIPTNRNNLFSLGKWDAAGGKYVGAGRKITLENKQSKTVATGSKIANNLYKLKFGTRLSRNKSGINNTETLHTYQTTEPVQNWETWHKHYGHISYSGLQKLLDKYMVEGLTVDKTSPKPDCEACIQAKQTIEPFNKTTN